MAKTLDPYHRWLGIPPKEQPANYYRLFGLSLFETDHDVVEGAYEQRIVLLRSIQTPEYVDLAQKLLNELAAAWVCLSDPAKKAEYDEKLRGELAPAPPPKANPRTPKSPQADNPPPIPRRIPCDPKEELRPQPAQPVGALWNWPYKNTLLKISASVNVLLLIGFLALVAISGRFRKVGVLRLKPIELKSVEAQCPLTFDVGASDPKAWEGNLRFRFSNPVPDGASLDPTSGRFTWTPRNPGFYQVMVEAVSIDREESSDMTLVSIEVREPPSPPKTANVAQPPVIKAIVDRSAEVGKEVTFNVSATAKPPRKLTFSLVDGPPGAKIDDETGQFTWTPSQEQGGTSYSLTVGVADDAPKPLQDEKSFVITVKPKFLAGMEDGWQRDARRFAEEHRGVLIQQPMTGGVAEVPQVAGQATGAFDPARTFLGPGKIRNESESFDFGDGFDGPVVDAYRQEVPGLAKAIGLQSVTVALEPLDKSYRLVLHGISLPGADANVEATVAGLRKQQEAIKQYLLLQLARTHTSADALAGAQQSLIQLLRVPLPILPNHSDPHFAQDPQAWEDARSQYEQQYQALLRHLPRLGQNQFVAIDSQMKRIRKQAQLDHDQRADSELRSRAKQIVAVVYSRPAKVEPPAAVVQLSRQITEISGHFDQTSEDATVVPGFIARVIVQIIAEPHGNPMPPSAWTKDGLVVKCVLTPARGQPLIKEGVAEFDPADLPQGTEKISLRFRFFRRGIFEGEDPQLIAETATYVLEGIRANQQYTVTFRMSQESLRALRDLSNGTRPGDS